MGLRVFHAAAAAFSLWCVNAIWWPQHATSVQLADDQPCEVFIWPDSPQNGQGNSVIGFIVPRSFMR